MRALLIVLFLIVPKIGYALSASEFCRSIPSETNTLYGKVELRMFPGEPQELQVLILTKPLCVIVSGFGVKDVQEIQLVDSNKKLEGIRDQEIAVKGDLFKRETERHHTLILLNVFEVLNAL
jgi:hypothetical protein